jgi:DNA modification methylase
MLIQADARFLPLRDQIVDCCVTSPPYFGLRDYGHIKQIGLESTPEAYIATLVKVFQGVWRVLKDNGTLWLNLADSYNGSGKARGNGGNGPSSTKQVTNRGAYFEHDGPVDFDGFKPKDLLGMPWRVAFALQADGWYLRSDIIWAKPNTMPESVTDRPTKAHEYVFLLTKQKRYYYDAAAIQEPVSAPEMTRRTSVNGMGNGELGNAARFGTPDVNGRNKRSVWTVNTEPYAGAHFATMPEALIEPCILAGCPLGGKHCDCNDVIETPLGDGPLDDPSIVTGRAGFNRPRRPNEGTRPITRREQRNYAEQMRVSPFRDQMAMAAGEAFAHYIRTDTSGARPVSPLLLMDWLGRGWLHEPAPCRCPIEPPGIVLDPFIGSGTVGAVAERLGRRWIGVDLAYHDLAKERTAQRGIRWTYDDSPVTAEVSDG